MERTSWPYWTQPESLMAVSRCVVLATQAHCGQFRKYNNLPYVTHPLRVALAVSSHPEATLAWVCAAVLHDVKEDTNLADANILEAAGREAFDYVVELTNTSKGLTGPDGKPLGRRERKLADWERLSQVSRPAKVIKMFDRIDNLMDMAQAERGFVRLYIEESYHLLSAIGSADSALAAQLDYACKYHTSWRVFTPKELAARPVGARFNSHVRGPCRVAEVGGVKVLESVEGTVALEDATFHMQELF